MTTLHTFDPNTHKLAPVNAVVLNPASGLVFDFLNAHPELAPGAALAGTTNCLKGFRLAQEIRKQLAPPRIAEPGWGVIVEAGVKQHGERLRWVRTHGEFPDHWNCEIGDEYDRMWSELIDPKVVQP